MGTFRRELWTRLPHATIVSIVVTDSSPLVAKSSDVVFLAAQLTVANQFGVTFQLFCKDECMETETWAVLRSHLVKPNTDTSLQAAAHMLEIDICVTTANGGTVFESKYQALHPSSTRPCFFLANSNNNHYWPFGLSAAPFQGPFMIL